MNPTAWTIWHKPTGKRSKWERIGGAATEREARRLMPADGRSGGHPDARPGQAAPDARPRTRPGHAARAGGPTVNIKVGPAESKCRRADPADGSPRRPAPSSTIAAMIARHVTPMPPVAAIPARIAGKAFGGDKPAHKGARQPATR